MNEPQAEKKEETIWRVPSFRMSYLHERFNKLQARARKLGCAEPQVIETGVEDVPVKEHMVNPATGRMELMATGEVKRYHLIKVTGEAPKYSGWSFVASIDRMPEAGNLVRVVPGQTLPETYWTATPCCDHCKTVRQRINHYVVRNEAGEHKMVGSSCLRDFLGHVSPENVAMLATFFSEISGVVDEACDEDGGSNGGYSEYLNLLTYLCYVSAAITKYGWLSRGRAEQEGRSGATADKAIDSMFPPKDRKDHPDRLVPSDEDKALAEKAIAWAQAIVVESDFDHNLSTIAKCEVLPGKAIGIAAAMVFCYKRKVEKEVLREKRAKLFAASAYVGEIKERRDFEVTVISEYQVEGNYGTTHIYKLLDNVGNCLTWFASSNVLEEGKSYVLKGTVKAHEEYKGTKQTIITRCKVVKTLEA